MPKIKSMGKLIQRKQDLVRLMDRCQDELDSINNIIDKKNRIASDNFKIVKSRQKVLI